MVSGLHSSINMHVSTNYIDFAKNKSFVNHEMYMSKLGKHEDRLRNLHFLFAAVAKAVLRAEKILSSYNYDTKLDKEQDSAAY
mmetsp:Transcript_40333/g.29732  ORF Transcript_40333/g.29732 Transcript_40333/m.29732 type:complete len:83 (+) Transcript_40333:99-347(+)